MPARMEVSQPPLAQLRQSHRAASPIPACDGDDKAILSKSRKVWPSPLRSTTMRAARPVIEMGRTLDLSQRGVLRNAQSAARQFLVIEPRPPGLPFVAGCSGKARSPSYSSSHAPNACAGPRRTDDGQARLGMLFAIAGMLLVAT